MSDNAAQRYLAIAGITALFMAPGLITLALGYGPAVLIVGALVFFGAAWLFAVAWLISLFMDTL